MCLWRQSIYPSSVDAFPKISELERRAHTRRCQPFGGQTPLSWEVCTLGCGSRTWGECNSSRRARIAHRTTATRWNCSWKHRHKQGFLWGISALCSHCPTGGHPRLGVLLPWEPSGWYTPTLIKEFLYRSILGSKKGNWEFAFRRL